MLLGELLALVHHGFVALDGGQLAALAVFVVFHAQAEPADGVLDRFADALGHGQPGHLEEQREAQAEQQQEQQGRAGEAEGDVGRVADQLAQHAAGGARQLEVPGPQAQVFEAEAAGEHDGEAGPAHVHLAGVRRFLGRGDAAGQAAPAAQHAAQEDHAPPPGGKAEDEQQQVGQPGARLAAQVGDLRDRVGMRPARVALVVAQEDEHEVQEGDGHGDPARFREEAREPARQGLARACRSGGAGVS